MLGSWFLIQLLSGVGSLNEAVRTGGGVAYWAHIGGFAAGMVAIAMLKLAVWRERLLPRAPRRSDYWRW